MKKIETGGAGRPKPTARAAAIACAALAAVLVAACAAGMARKPEERQVKLRYDGQTYVGQESSAGGRHDGYDMAPSFGTAPKNELMGVTAPSDSVDMAPSAGMDASGAGASNSSPEAGPPDEPESSVGQHGKKLAYYYDYTAESTDFDGFRSALEAYVADRGGYVEATYTDSREHDLIGRDERTAVRMGTWDIRLPADDAKSFGAFFDGVSAQVTESDVRMRDRTEAYADASLQAESYRAEYARLEALIPQAQSVSELIEIQDRLSSLNYQIQWQEKQKDLIDEDVEMSSISLTVYEVIYYTATFDAYRFRMGERMADAFEDFLYTAPYFLFAMAYLAIGGFVVIGLCSVLFRVLFNIRNKKSRDQVVRLVSEDIKNNKDI